MPYQLAKSSLKSLLICSSDVKDLQNILFFDEITSFKTCFQNRFRPVCWKDEVKSLLYSLWCIWMGEEKLMDDKKSKLKTQKPHYMLALKCC